MSLEAKRRELLELILAVSFRRGRVKLASGKESDFYLDLRQTLMRPRGVALAGELVLDRLRRGPAVDAVGGMAVGAVPLVAAVLAAAAAHDPDSKLIGFFVRKETKAHGLGRRIEGGFQAGQSVALVEDTVTTGGSTLDARRRRRGGGRQGRPRALPGRPRGRSRGRLRRARSRARVAVHARRPSRLTERSSAARKSVSHGCRTGPTRPQRVSGRVLHRDLARGDADAAQPRLDPAGERGGPARSRRDPARRAEAPLSRPRPRRPRRGGGPARARLRPGRPGLPAGAERPGLHDRVLRDPLRRLHRGAAQRALRRAGGDATSSRIPRRAC